MNQCQWSDEKIIKKQACAVLNIAKGKRPILLYRNTIWTGNEDWLLKGGKGRVGETQNIIADAKMPFRWHYEWRLPYCTVNVFIQYVNMLQNSFRIYDLSCNTVNSTQDCE